MKNILVVTSSRSEYGLLANLIKDISKFYGVEFGEVNKVTSTMIAEATPAAKMKHGIQGLIVSDLYEEGY